MSSAIKLTLVDQKGMSSVSNKKPMIRSKGESVVTKHYTKLKFGSKKKLKRKLIFLQYHLHQGFLESLPTCTWKTNFGNQLLKETVKMAKDENKHPCIDEQWVRILKHYQIHLLKAIRCSHKTSGTIYRRKSANGLHLNSPTNKLNDDCFVCLIVESSDSIPALVPH